HRYSLRDLFGLWVRRHRPAVVATALAGASVLTVAPGAYWGLAEARDGEREAKLAAQRERDQAEDARAQAEATRERETQRLDRSIIAQARRYVGEDPALAVAWMRLLSDAAPAWESEVPALAMEAAANGVSDGVWSLPLEEPLAMTISADGRYLFMAGRKDVVRMNLADAGVERISELGAGKILVSSADGRVAAFTEPCSDKLQIWREGAGVRELAVSVPPPEFSFMTCPSIRMALSADGRWLGYGVFLGKGPRYGLVDLERHAVVAEHDETKGSCRSPSGTTIAISPQGWMAFPASGPGALRYWDLESAGTTKPTTVTYAGDCIDDLRLSSSGTYLLAGQLRAGDGMVRAMPSLQDRTTIVWAGPGSETRRYEGSLIPGPDDSVWQWATG
ncbi:MAG: WD40 repeat domain-containing protein, partial [Myxococcales bacterium]|nr:WD40 repeat domain-containing protein [Myxococcales bacterium]